jgi:hypothetical protein
MRELSGLLAPSWLSPESRKLWHRLLGGVEVVAEGSAVQDLYGEIVRHFAAAVDELGDMPLIDDTGAVPAPAQAINEAGAAMFALQEALGAGSIRRLHRMSAAWQVRTSAR